MLYAAAAWVLCVSGQMLTPSRAPPPPALLVLRKTNEARRGSGLPELCLNTALGGAAAMASAYDIVHNEFVKITSSLNMAIMGNSKVHRRAMPPMVPRAAPLRYRD